MSNRGKYRLAELLTRSKDAAAGQRKWTRAYHRRLESFVADLLELFAADHSVMHERIADLEARFTANTDQLQQFMRNTEDQQVAVLAELKRLSREMNK